MKNDTHCLNMINADFLAAHHIDDTYTMNALHFHNAFEIYLAQTGGLSFFVNNRIYPVEKNDLFIFNHLDLHRIGIVPGTHYERYLIVFKPDYIADMSTASTDLLECYLKRPPQFNHRVHLTDEEAQRFISLHRKAAGIINTGCYGEDVLRRIILVEILVFVNRLYTNNPGYVPGSSSRGYSKIKPILLYINEHIDMELTLEHLAQQFYISRYYLCKLFKQVTGFTFKEYVIYHRIIRASELLRKNLPVSHVSEMSGFKNYCHFITAFKNITGITPKQYAMGENML